MEYLRGESLGAHLERVGRLPFERAVALALEVASALAAAHRAGIIHRDLKPDNVFLAKGQLGDEMVKVLDFGIAKLRADVAGVASATQTGALYGTPVYMSPEQCRDFRNVDARTDVYALGAMLYQMVCGAPPFVSEAIGELIFMHLSRAPEPARQRFPELPAALDQAILRALAKDPDDRFASMEDFAAALTACLPVSEQPQLAMEPQLPRPAAFSLESTKPQRSPAQWKLYPVVVGVFVLAALVSAAFGLRGKNTTGGRENLAPGPAVERNVSARAGAGTLDEGRRPQVAPEASANPVLTAPMPEAKPGGEVRPSPTRAKQGRATSPSSYYDLVKKNPY